MFSVNYYLAAKYTDDRKKDKVVVFTSDNDITESVWAAKFFDSRKEAKMQLDCFNKQLCCVDFERARVVPFLL